MHLVLVLFAKVLKRLGSKEPIESAITLLTVMQGTLVIGVMILAKVLMGIVIDKPVFLVFAAALFVFNQWYLAPKARKYIRESAVVSVGISHVILAVALYFIFTMGVFLILIPIVKVLT